MTEAQAQQVADQWFKEMSETDTGEDHTTWLAKRVRATYFAGFAAGLDRIERATDEFMTKLKKGIVP